MFSQTLRAHTAAAHAELERMPKFTAVFQPQATKQDYVNLLEAFYSAHCSLGDWRSPLARSLPYVPFDRCERLASDLRALGVRPLHSTRGVPLETAEAWGVAYVVEGSTLGGQILLPKVQKLFPKEPLSVFSYFSGYGSQTASNWNHFRQALNAWAEKHPTSLDSAAQKAVHVFECFRQALED